MSHFLQKVLKSPSTQNLLGNSNNSNSSSSSSKSLNNSNNSVPTNNTNTDNNNTEISTNISSESTTIKLDQQQPQIPSDEIIKQLPDPPTNVELSNNNSISNSKSNSSSNLLSNSPVLLAESNRSDSTTSLSSVSSNSTSATTTSGTIPNSLSVSSNLQRQYSNTSIKSDDSSSLGTMTTNSLINEDYDDTHSQLSSSVPTGGSGSMSTPTSPTPFSYTGQQSKHNSGSSKKVNLTGSTPNSGVSSPSTSVRSSTPISDVDSPINSPLSHSNSSNQSGSSRLDKFMKKGAQMLRPPDLHIFSRSEKKSSSSKKKKPKFDLDTEISAPYSVIHKMHVDFDLKWTGHNDFVLDEKLGDGAYGSVYKGTHKDLGFTLAIKVIEIKESEAQSLQNEINILKNCKSNNIVSYFGSLQNEDKVWILMDFCSLGSIRDIIESTENTLNESQISFVIKHVLKGLIYLHNQNIIHRDVKAANILLNDQSEVKLADFGVSEKLTDMDDQSKEMIGTPLWMAPEVILKKNYDYKADIWSLGITIIEMADGLPPHMDMNPMRAMKMVPIWSPPTFAEPKKWSPLLNDFLSKCLMKDPEKRSSPKDLLNHPFLKKTKGPEVLGDLIHQVLRLKKKKHDELKKQQQQHPESTSNENTEVTSSDLTHNTSSTFNLKTGGLMDTATRGTMVFKGIYSTCHEIEDEEEVENEDDEDDEEDDEDVDPFSTTVFHANRPAPSFDNDADESEPNGDDSDQDNSENEEEYSSTGTMVRKIKKPTIQRHHHSRSKSTSAAIAMSELMGAKQLLPITRASGAAPLKPLPPLPPHLQNQQTNNEQLTSLIHEEFTSIETKLLTYIDSKNREAVEDIKEHVSSVERNLISYVNQELQNVLSVFSLKLQPLMASLEELKSVNQQLLQQQQQQPKSNSPTPMITKHSMILEQPKRCTSPILSNAPRVSRPLSSSTASLEDISQSQPSQQQQPTTTNNVTSSPSSNHSFRPLSAPVIHETLPIQINQRTSAPIPGGRAPVLSSIHANSPPKHVDLPPPATTQQNNNSNNQNNIQAKSQSPVLRRMSSLPKINSPDTSTSSQSPNTERKTFYKDDHIDINKHLVTEKLKIFQQQQKE